MLLPGALVDSLKDTAGFDLQAFTDVHTSGEQVVSIRLNPLKANDIEISTEQHSVIDLPKTTIPWSSRGFYLDQRPSFTFDPLFHAGLYYVQEASSMFLEQAFSQSVPANKPLRVLDLCAAPGGKSTLLQSILPRQSLLVSNEVIKSRAGILEENIIKWGGCNCIVTNNDPADLARLRSFFDVIVVDAPCSGSGLFRRDPEAISEWSEQAVELCSQRQQRILADSWPALKNGGTLIYSTCSYSEREDEDIADWIIDEWDAASIPLKISSDWNIVETQSSKHAANGYRFWPDKVKGEGFFIACFRKRGEDDGDSRPFKKAPKLEKLSRAEENVLLPWLQRAPGIQMIRQGDSILAVDNAVAEGLPALMAASIYVRQAGVRVGKIAGSELIPDHALAMSNLLSEEVVAVSLKYNEVIQYLRRDEVEIKGKTGWALVQYRGINLGWVKILSNRVNNYYPKEWRILKKP